MTAQFFVAAFEAHHGLDLDQGIKKSLCLQASSGAGGGNRTRDSCLEGKGITTMQRPQRCALHYAVRLGTPTTMTESLAVRRATTDDLDAIRRIYNEGVEDRVATLDRQPRSL